jgi:formamidopyrimidine-DNA glycosylase
MSEGPEVKIVADKILQAALSESIVDIKSNKLDQQMKRKILHSKIKSVKTYGKNIVIQFSSGIYLRNHMMIWGKWRIYDRKDFDNGIARPPPQRSYFSKYSDVKTSSVIPERIESLDVRKDTRIRLIITTANKVLIEFNGPIIEFSSDDPSRRAPISLLGPDGLDLNYDKNKVISNLHSKSENYPDLLISDCLLDQQIISGIGNKYKSEILFLNSIYPFRKVSSLSNNELDELATSIPNVLHMGFKNNGSTTISSSNNKRQFQNSKHWVFRRSGKDCLKCETKIISERTMTKRQTFWCPKCQAQ